MWMGFLPAFWAGPPLSPMGLCAKALKAQLRSPLVAPLLGLPPLVAYLARSLPSDQAPIGLTQLGEYLLGISPLSSHPSPISTYNARFGKKCGITLYIVGIYT